MQIYEKSEESMPMNYRVLDTRCNYIIADISVHFYVDLKDYSI